MMNRLTRCFLVVMIGMLCLAFAGCGAETQATLEDIAASDGDITKTIKEQITVPAGMTATVEFSGDSFDIVYTYDDSISEEDAKALTAAFESNSEGVKANCTEAISALEQQTEITGITGTILFKNSNGEELWNCTCPEQ